MTLHVKNWASFQHYKDRNPPWIKLHRSLIDNVDFHNLSAEAGKNLPLIWIIASERGGILPELGELAWRLHIKADVCEKVCAELLESRFLEPAERVATPAQLTAKQVAESNGFGTRHISDAVKRAAWVRDGGKCVECGSTENIEYDHVIPVSKGGNSDLENIQLLCRPCNRKKRNRLSKQAEHTPLSSRSLETETEEEAERESDGSTLVFQIATSYPKASHYRNELELPPALADAIIQAIDVDGPETVLQGTQDYAANLDNPDFAPDPYKFFKQFLYRRKHAPKSASKFDQFFESMEAPDEQLDGSDERSGTRTGKVQRISETLR